MNEPAQPTTAELMAAIVSLHAFTESGLQQVDAKVGALDAKVGALDAKVDSLDARLVAFDKKFPAFDRFAALDTKIEVLHFEMNKRFDRVYDDLDEIKSRVSLLEARPA